MTLRRPVRPGRPLAAAAAVCALLAACAGAPAPLPLPPAPLDLPDEIWVHNTLSDMSLEERVGQMLMLRVEGGFENHRGPAMREIERLVDEARVGGFVVGLGSPLDVASKLNELQSRARLPLVFGADLEWGAGMRLWRPTYLPYGIEAAGGTAFPFNMGIAATGDVHMAELAGRITAREARAVGIHWVFAPVVDINTAHDNPIVNIRSYGSDPIEVGQFAAAFIRGATAGGVLTTAKHFPGHGDTHVDSHVEMPVIEASLETIEARELHPFRAAIAAGVSSIMLGHIAVPALTDGAVVPATLAPQIGSDLLRNRLRFRGLVITDAMTMGALRDVPGYSPGEIAIRAVEAGADVVLSPPDPVLAHRALVAAVRSGRLHYTRVDSSVARILRAKARLGLHRERTVPIDSVTHIVGAPEHETVAADIAERSLTLARDSARILPLDPRRIRRLAVVAFSAPMDVRAGAALATELRRIYGRDVTFVRVDENSSEAVRDSAVAAAARADAAIFATFLMPISGQGHLTVPPGAASLAARMRSRAKRMMVASFGDPYGPATLPGSGTYLLAWQPRGELAQRAAARAIAGLIPITGRLPIQLPATPAARVERPALDGRLSYAAPEAVGMDRFVIDRVDSIIEAAIVRGASPGATVAIGRHGRLVLLRAYGDLDRRRGFPSVTDSSIYDLASVTKVVATTTALMMLVDEGLLSLDDPVKQHIPEWRGTPVKESVTLRNLLLHNSGLAAYGPLWRELQGRDQYRRRIAAMSLEYEPGARTLYSDFGIILLGLIIEQVSGRPLDVLLSERVFQPLGMRDTGFNPLQWPYGTLDLDGDDGGPRTVPDPLIARIAPTEVDTVFRNRHIRGQVHDENAFALGGVAGHAGLFSSARDMAVFAQMMLNGGFYDGRRYIDPATIADFTRRQSEHSSRALGWDTPVEGGSAGSYFTSSAYGHTGFTGPSIWIDPERDVFIVLLLNRVNPTRDNQRHIQLRRDLADIVQTAINDMAVERRVDIINQRPD
ncbi:MAG TPA: glycoside hydrolase family 3 N-terminal domain-containing protein [Longimicrobiales bacterium]|nr:glycoside hydrolase family 3 N-terminal domain-containing protein [Longimicrobiales bacterium]